MTDIDQAAALDLDEPSGRSPLVKWGLIGIVVLGLIGGGGAVWYFFLGGKEHFSPQQAKQVETPLPYFMELKPFVLGFKTEDLQTSDGVNKVRRAVKEHLNEVVKRVLGDDRITKMTAETGSTEFIQNVLFSTLIVE
jgi:flagellar basal body-associated protein FliL